MKKAIFLAFLLVIALTSSSSAGMIDLQFKSKGSLGKNLSGVTANFSEGRTYGGHGAWAGKLKIEISGDAEFDFNGIHEVFCTELDEYAGANRSYEIDTLNNLTIPSTAPAMNNAQKVAIERLFSIHDTVDTDVEAAGFQVAIWEISQDVEFGDLQGSNKGNFFLTGSGTNFDDILGSANGFLSQLGGLSQVSVLGMVSDGSQDFVTANPEPQGVTPVPEPTSLAVWGLGVLGFGLRRRRA